MNERQVFRLAVYAAIAVVAYTVLVKSGGLGGTSIRNLGGVPIGGTPNFGGRGGM